MSSIQDLFGDLGLNEEGSNAPFDPSTLNDVLDNIMRDRPVAGAPEGYVPDPPATLPDPGLAPTPPPVAPDLFSGMNDLERQELLAIRQAMADPERQQAVRRAYLGVGEPAPVAAAPPPPAETLPEDVDPDSFEAKLWKQNQTLMARVEELSQGVAHREAQTDAERAQEAAKRVTAAFKTRYGDRLSDAEIMAIASTAGARKLPDAFLPTTDGNIEAAMAQSLEFVLRSDDALLAKVLGQPAATPGVPGHTPEAADRQRKLTALSSAASPTGDVPTRQPLTHRPDGRLDEGSRNSLIATMMGKLNEGEG